MALAILLAVLAGWLEALAPDLPLPVFLLAVGVSALVCGAGPGMAVMLGAALAIWWFAATDPDGPVPQLPDWVRLLVFLVASAVLLGLAGAARRRMGAARGD